MKTQFKKKFKIKEKSTACSSLCNGSRIRLIDSDDSW